MLKDKRNEEKRFYELEEEMTPNKSFKKKNVEECGNAQLLLQHLQCYLEQWQELPIRCHL